MTTHATYTGPAQDEPIASFETVDGDVVVYDREDPFAWLQSDTLAAVRE